MTMVETARASDEELWATLSADARRLDVRLTLARGLVEEGRVGDAAALLGGQKAFVKAAPELHAEAARLLTDLGDHAGACRHLARALLQAPTAKLVRQHDEALEALVRDADIGLSPMLRTRYFKGLERLRRGDAAGAAQTLAKVAQRAPLFAPAWALWRGALETSGDAERAADLPRLWRRMGGPGPAVASAAMRRRLSPRGLVFDPREPAPSRRNEEILKPVGSAAELTETPDSVWRIAEGEQRRKWRPALTPDGAPDLNLQLQYRTRDVFIASVADAALVGRGAVVNANGELLSDLIPRQDPAKYGGAWEGEAMRFDPRLLRDGALNVTFHERPAFLMTGPTDTSFGDWMLNFLPRLALYRAARLDCDIVIRSDPLHNALEWLATMGVPESRIVRHDVRGVSVFPTLYAPSWPLPAARPMDKLFDVYRQVEAPPDAPRGRKLYLTRQGLGRRPLVNEAEVEALFVRRGFEVVRPEALSIEEMRRVFAYPACVAGAYGSAVLNLVFCKSRPQCLFLVPPERPTFLRQLALWLACMGLSFRYLVGEPAGEGSALKIAPWTVRPDEVDDLVGRMLADAEREAAGVAAE